MSKIYYRARNALFRLPFGRDLHDAAFDGWVRLRESGKAPVRRITRGPGFHWRGYYDKLLFDPTGRYVLAHRSEFEHRSPRPDDSIRVGMIDLEEGDRWIELGESIAWNWQQGCMLQWMPGSESEVLWNDRQDGEFVSHILDVHSGRRRTISHAVYCLSPDGALAMTTDFRRLNDRRPGYGYAGIADPNRACAAPTDAGIWKVDMATGASKLVISIAEVAAIPHAGGFPADTKHWFNHLLFNTTGSRFLFLHRWADQSKACGFSTRMFTANPDGSDLYVLDPHGETSHFVWRDAEHVMAWAWHPSKKEAFYLYRDRSDDVHVVGEGIMTRNGHNTYVPGTNNDWILNDTYPDRQRFQRPYLFHAATSRRIPLGVFKAPPQYNGEFRCDLHPAASRDGAKIVIDSAHEGQGRQLYLIDISKIVHA